MAAIFADDVSIWRFQMTFPDDAIFADDVSIWRFQMTFPDDVSICNFLNEIYEFQI